MISRFTQIPGLEAVDTFIQIKEGVPVFLGYSPIGKRGKNMVFQGLRMLPDIVKSKNSHIEGTGLLALSGEPVRIRKVRMFQAKGTGLLVHQVDKDLLRTCQKLGDGQSGVIG